MAELEFPNRLRGLALARRHFGRLHWIAIR